MFSIVSSTDGRTKINFPFLCFFWETEEKDERYVSKHWSQLTPKIPHIFWPAKKIMERDKNHSFFFLLQIIMVTTCSSQLLGFAKCQLKLILLWKLNENRLCRWPLAKLPFSGCYSKMSVCLCSIYSIVVFNSSNKCHFWSTPLAIQIMFCQKLN